MSILSKADQPHNECICNLVDFLSRIPAWRYFDAYLGAVRA
jgi:hypothetical protein